MNDTVDPDSDAEDVVELPRTARRISFRRIVAAVVIIGLIAALAHYAEQYVSFDELRQQRVRLEGFVSAHRVMGALIYMGLYVLVVALSLPGALIMTMSGGFLFGAAWGSVAAVIGASTGAVVMYLMASSRLADPLRRIRRVQRLIRKFEEHASRDAFAYLLTLRMIPAMPFWLINIAAGCVRMRLSTYALATVIGIAPSTVIYASVGSTLGEVFDRGGEAGLNLLLQPNVLTPLACLALLAFAPLAWGLWRRRSRASAGPGM
jgi:uncharacterized membrane protein YdjX (TVP38/TMEM64 family)